jgi:uncharacterized protein (DUF1015 family)
MEESKMSEVTKDMNGYKITHLTRAEAEALRDALSDSRDEVLNDVYDALDDVIRNGSGW